MQTTYQKLPFQVIEEAVLTVPGVKIQLLQMDLLEHQGDVIETTLQCREGYWLDLCLTPRPVTLSACYADHWGGNRYLPVGNMFLVPPGEQLRVKWQRPEQGDVSQKSLVCQIEPQRMECGFDTQSLWGKESLEVGLDIADRSLQGIAMRLTRELLSPGLASQAMIDTLITLLTLELMRFFSQLSESFKKGGLAAWRLRVIEERLKQPGKAPALSELALLCKLSPRQLSRAFQVSRGCSVGNYVTQVRIEMAKEKLLAGCSVSAVAATMGFASASNFTYSFRQATGVSPTQYQLLC